MKCLYFSIRIPYCHTCMICLLVRRCLQTDRREYIRFCRAIDDRPTDRTTRQNGRFSVIVSKRVYVSLGFYEINSARQQFIRLFPSIKIYILIKILVGLVVSRPPVTIHVLDKLSQQITVDYRPLVFYSSTISRTQSHDKFGHVWHMVFHIQRSIAYRICCTTAIKALICVPVLVTLSTFAGGPTYANIRELRDSVQFAVVNDLAWDLPKC